MCSGRGVYSPSGTPKARMFQPGRGRNPPVPREAAGRVAGVSPTLSLACDDGCRRSVAGGLLGCRRVWLWWCHRVGYLVALVLVVMLVGQAARPCSRANVGTAGPTWVRFPVSFPRGRKEPTSTGDGAHRPRSIRRTRGRGRSARGGCGRAPGLRPSRVGRRVGRPRRPGPGWGTRGCSCG